MEKEKKVFENFSSLFSFPPNQWSLRKQLEILLGRGSSYWVNTMISPILLCVAHLHSSLPCKQFINRQNVMLSRSTE
jgi:fructoselysine-6-P-deglycase FrlB-like protein